MFLFVALCVLASLVYAPHRVYKVPPGVLSRRIWPNKDYEEEAKAHSTSYSSASATRSPQPTASRQQRAQIINRPSQPPPL